MPFPDFTIISRDELEAFIELEEARVRPICDRLQAELTSNMEQWEASTRDLTNLRFTYDKLTEQLRDPRKRHSARAQRDQVLRNLPVLLHIRKLLEMIRSTTQECLAHEIFPLNEAKLELTNRNQLGID